MDDYDMLEQVDALAVGLLPWDRARVDRLMQASLDGSRPPLTPDEQATIQRLYALHVTAQGHNRAGPPPPGRKT